MSNVVILAASTGKNVELANTLAGIVRDQGAEAEIVDVVALDLPLYSTSAEGGGIPGAAAEMSAKLCASRALIVVAPEYNGAMPPALTNLIAWISRSGDKDWRGAFNTKITAIATFSGGGGGFVLAACVPSSRSWARTSSVVSSSRTTRSRSTKTRPRPSSRSCSRCPSRRSGASHRSNRGSGHVAAAPNPEIWKRGAGSGTPASLNAARMAMSTCERMPVRLRTSAIR